MSPSLSTLKVITKWLPSPNLHPVMSKSYSSSLKYNWMWKFLRLWETTRCWCRSLIISNQVSLIVRDGGLKRAVSDIYRPPQQVIFIFEHRPFKFNNCRFEMLGWTFRVDRGCHRCRWGDQFEGPWRRNSIGWLQCPNWTPIAAIPSPKIGAMFCQSMSTSPPKKMFKFPTDKEVSIKFKSISRKPFSNLKKNESLPDNLTKYQLENPTKNQLRIHQKSIRKSRKNLPKLEQKSSVSPPSNSTKNQQRSSEKVTALNRDQYST